MQICQLWANPQSGIKQHLLAIADTHLLTMILRCVNNNHNIRTFKIDVLSSLFRMHLIKCGTSDMKYRLRVSSIGCKTLFTGLSSAPDIPNSFYNRRFVVAPSHTSACTFTPDCPNVLITSKISCARQVPFVGPFVPYTATG